MTNDTSSEEITHSEVKTHSTDIHASSSEELLKNQQSPQPLLDPQVLANVVMRQMHQVNSKKDELTIAIKALSDTTEQLLRAYAGNVHIIQQLVKQADSTQNTRQSEE